MGSVPSRETHRRGIFSVQQQFPPTNEKSSQGSAAAAARKQEIVLIPLTKEFFPSPDCALFVQFHKARCDAAVNYYFRQPGNPGDLSCIPNYASSYRLPGEEEALQQRRRERAERRRERAAARAATAKHFDGDLFAPDDADDLGRSKNSTSVADGDDEDEDDDEEEDESFPSREALYRGVVERVEEALFDTDAEMCEAFQWACAHPHTTMGPDGRKKKKVLPVLCAVAFRYDPGKVAAAAAAATGVSPSGSGATAAAAAASVSAHHQAAVENGVYIFGSIMNIVGCFGFVSMEEEVAALRREMELHNHAEGTAGPRHQRQNSTAASHSFSAAAGAEVMHLSSPQSPTPGRSYKHDPYSFTSSPGSSVSSSANDSLRGGTLLVSRASGSSGGGRRTAAISSLHAMVGTGSGTPDPNTPPPVAAPLAAMVFLTKSAGEQNLGRVTHIAATTYYFQLIQAGVIPRQPVRAPPGATAPPPPPYYGLGGPTHEGSPTTPLTPSVGAQSPTTASHAAAAAAAAAAGTHHPKAHLPPMETFSFSSLVTNIPILSFVYEMKCRWGYLGVFRGTPTSADSSLTELTPAMAASASAASQRGEAGSSTGGDGALLAHRRALQMGTHSSGGLTGVDRTVGQNLTDEIEMWVTADQMLHGRISKDLAERLCWALAERPEVMHERVLQLPSEECGYWRYQGLVDRAHPPPLPQPGVAMTTPVHPRDVYVMGSDVLPGFNEGDILRFDPERLVWFSDPSIPLEGVVLAAMRPYCKMAREAPPDDPGWVTTIESVEKLEYDKAREARENPALFQFLESEPFPLPPATQDQEATLRTDSNLTRVHEHVGNFFVYRFERNGTTYCHGTVPNFANPNKKRAPAAGGAPVGPGSAHTHPHAPGGGAPPATPITAANANAAPHLASPAPSSGSGKQSSAAATHTTTTSGAGANNTNTSGGSTVEVPKSIAAALFSLAQPSASSTTTDRLAKDAGAPATASAATTAPATAAAGHTGTEERGGVSSAADGPPTSATAPPSQSSKPAPAYLTGRVTSKSMMQTARRWVESLYSYAYGMPKPNSAAAAADHHRVSSRGTTPSHGPGAASANGGPAPLSPLSPMGFGAGPSRAGHPGTSGGAMRVGTPVSPGLSASGTVGGTGGSAGGSAHAWGAGRSEGASAVWPQRPAKADTGRGTSSRSVTPMGGVLASAPSLPQPQPLAQPSPVMSGYPQNNPTFAGSHTLPSYAQGAPYAHSVNQRAASPYSPQTQLPPSPHAPAGTLNTAHVPGDASGSGFYIPSSLQAAPSSGATGQPTWRYVVGEDGYYTWVLS